jgi:hypothetical protein
MIYREAGDFKTTYKADQETFPIRLDKVGFWLSVLVVVLVIPFFLNDYWEKAVFLPFFHIRDCRYWSKYFDWILWSGFVRDWRIYGCRCLLEL